MTIAAVITALHAAGEQLNKLSITDGIALLSLSCLIYTVLKKKTLKTQTAFYSEHRAADITPPLWQRCSGSELHWSYRRSKTTANLTDLNVAVHDGN